MMAENSFTGYGGKQRHLLSQGSPREVAFARALPYPEVPGIYSSLGRRVCLPFWVPH